MEIYERRNSWTKVSKRICVFIVLLLCKDELMLTNCIILSKVEQSSRNIPLKLSFPSSDHKVDPRWLVMGGDRVIPGSVYRVAVAALKGNHIGEKGPITFSASLTIDGRQVTSSRTTCEVGEQSDIYLQAPLSSTDGKWEFHIDGFEAGTEQLIFKNSTRLKFSPNFLTILIQTSRPVYTAKQTVHFRTVLLNNELKGYEDPVELYILDPQGNVMRRWPSRHSWDGIINLNFKLPDYPLTGNWTIQVRAGLQVQNKTILVEHYFRPRFEVFVRLPQVFRVNDEDIIGTVVSNMTNWRHVYGNCSIKLQIATNKDFPIPTKFRTLSKLFYYNFTGVQLFNFSLGRNSSTERRSQRFQDGDVIRVLAEVGDTFGWQIQKGFALARIFREELKLRFVDDQPLFFRPGMNFTVHLFVSYSDDQSMAEQDLEESVLVVSCNQCEGGAVVINGSLIAEESGIAKASFISPAGVNQLQLSARIKFSNGLSKEAQFVALRHHSPRDHHLQVETSTRLGLPGENIILHVRNNFFINHFNMIVVSNGVVIHTDRERVVDRSIPTVTTLFLPASSEMAPAVNILVWALDYKGEIIAHSITVPVNPLHKHKVTVRWNEHKDHSGGSSEVKMQGEKGSSFAASAIWEETFLMDSGHNLDESRVLDQMLGLYDDVGNYTLRSHTPKVGRVMTRSRYGEGSELKFVPTSNTGSDVPTTFRFAGLVILTDASFYYHPGTGSDVAPCNRSEFTCLTGGCFSHKERCNGEFDCSDYSDEMGCDRRTDPSKQFRIHRLSRMHRFYDPDGGDWAWRDLRREGREISVFPFPKRPQHWVFSVFAVGKEKGFGIMRYTIKFDTAGPFMLTAEGPPVARMWEQVGLSVGVFNFHYGIVGVLITVPDSPDYRTIAVEKNGIVDSYDPRKVEGTFQHVVWVPANSSIGVNIPIVFTRTGEVEVTVYGATQMQKDAQTVTINVVPEGCTIAKHTSLLLDLKDRAIVYEFMDIHLDESPIIPYSLLRRYIFGTPQGHISVTGDVVGPAFPVIPVGADSLLGNTAMGAETSAYNFAANIWTLHYLRLTNQITESITYKVLTAVNVEYASVGRYQGPSGGFSNWIGCEESVWLTAYAIKNLWVANFQDWENLIYIDPNIIKKAVRWMLQFQTDYGSFSETPFYLHPLDSKVDPRSRHDWLPKYQNISLTAYVVTTLSEVITAIDGDLHYETTLATQRAVKYLENLLQTIDDPYDLALVAWALTKAKSSEKELAFSKLDVIKRVADDRIYWSREPVGFNNIVYEDSQKPYIQVKDDQKWDAHAVETTAYALLVYLKRDGIGIIQENIVRFLASMRELDGGFISTVDSVVAMEALVDYSNRARIRDITNMKVLLEHSYTTFKKPFEVVLDNSQTLSKMRTFELENIFGHFNIYGRGSGQALIQLDYTYGIDVESGLDPPPVPSFEFNIHAQYTGRNNSYVKITSCQRWINVNETETSGLAVVDIHLPSGYYIMQDELIRMVNARTVKNLRWALRTDTQVKFFFNKIDSEQVCFTYRLERWYPVSNHSRHNFAMVYELYQPERFKQYLFEVYPLYALDICEVCGSYQCPYCPFYSSSPNMAAVQIFIILSFLLSVFLT